jgi:hypothetical protein
MTSRPLFLALLIRKGFISMHHPGIHTYQQAPTHIKACHTWTPHPLHTHHLRPCHRLSQGLAALQGSLAAQVRVAACRHATSSHSSKDQEMTKAFQSTTRRG